MLDLDKALLQYPDRVADLFKGKTILVTGGTGLIGKVLVEKMLRCLDLKKIYLLIRTKKGKDPNERLKDVFSCPLYDVLKEKYGEGVFNKVEAIASNVEDVDLGISKEDRQKIARETEIIYHCAATVRFGEDLKYAVLLNVRGTKYMLDLAKECENLQVFSYVSTAYSQPLEKVLYEKTYPPPADPHDVIKIVEHLSEDSVATITSKLVGNFPNTYSFTKSLAEALVAEQMDNIPATILRPSVVTPIWKEPLPGWTGNLNGPTGLLIGAGKGVIRTMYCKGDSCADYIPVDVAVNAMLLTVFDFITFGKRKVYNLTSSAEHQVSFRDIIELGKKIVNEKMPLNNVAWYPGGTLQRSRFLHNVCFYLFHIIPAILGDSIIFACGYKPVLMRIQKRIARGYEVFEYYANNEWDFNNEDSMQARDLLNPREKATYKVDGDGMDYYEYFLDCVHAARLYILKEPDDTLPAARRHMKIMWCLDTLVKGLFIFGVLYYLYKTFMTFL